MSKIISLLFTVSFVIVPSLVIAKEDQSGGDVQIDAPKETATNHRWSLYMQDLMMHRDEYLTRIFNDNTSNEITQSALLKRFTLRYHPSSDIKYGVSTRINLRDESVLINGTETNRYHPFKAVSLMAGYKLHSNLFTRAQLETWVNVRTDLALTDRFFSKSSLQSDLEIVLAITAGPLVTFGLEYSANQDEGSFYSMQYGIGWRF